MTSNETYRIQIRETLQALSDEALRFQDARIVGGIDREECDREIRRRTIDSHPVFAALSPEARATIARNAEGR